MTISSEVGRDGEEPWAQGAVIGRQLLGMLPSPQDRLLHDVLCASSVTRELGGVTQEGSCVLIKEHAHKLSVSVLSGLARDEFPDCAHVGIHVR